MENLAGPEQLTVHNKHMISKPLDKEDLDVFFDSDAIDVFDYFLHKAIFSQPEILEKQDPLPVQIPKEHIEQWGVQALGAKPIGAGSYPVDLIDLDKGYGADIKMLSWDNKTSTGKDSNSMSGETSIAQKFEDENLDEKFKNKKHNEIIKSWVQILNDKFQEVIETYNKINDIYYFILIKEKDGEIENDKKGNKFHICGLKVDYRKFSEFSYKKHSKQAVWVGNFIDDSLGDVKIYKSKKRMELRLKPLEWIKQQKVITFELDKFVSPTKNLLELTKESRYNYLSQKFVEIFKPSSN